MEVIQMIKKLNNTELGKGGTNDTYVLVPKELDVLDLFPLINERIGFINKLDGEVIYVRYTADNEKRIVGLGPFYKKYNVCAGDQIIFERQITQGESQYYINLKINIDRVVLQKRKSGFEILTEERLNLINKETVIEVDGIMKPFQIIFLRSEKKRKDSPRTTDYYDVLIGDESMLNKDSGNDFLEIKICNNIAKIKNICTWKKYKFMTEEENE